MAVTVKADQFDFSGAFITPPNLFQQVFNQRSVGKFEFDRNEVRV